MTQNTDANHDIDRYIGQRVRVARLAARMTQKELGAELGLTFQQVHKYEIGENHISAARLYQVATAIGMAPGDFFPDDDGMISDALTLIDRADVFLVLRAIKMISGNKRKTLIDIIESFAAKIRCEERPPRG